MEHLKSEISGDFQHAIISLMQTPSEFDANELRWAMKGLGTDEATLIEILTTRSNAEIADIKTVYNNCICL